MKTFERYLFEKGLLPATIKWNSDNMRNLGGIISATGVDLKEMQYEDLLDFIVLLQKNEVKPERINRHLKTLSYYFDYLIEQKERSTNPAFKMKSTTFKRKRVMELLSQEQLEELYETYEVKSDKNKLMKLILGFVLFQAMRTGEIAKLKVGDIDIRKGEITIRMTVVSEHRKLKLSPQQMISIYQYLNENKTILATDNFFLNQNTHSLLSYAIEQLKKKHSYLKGVVQLRPSVITNWLKQHDVMTVKYMAGHRWVSSTEWYNLQSVEELKQKILRVHPMG